MTARVRIVVSMALLKEPWRSRSSFCCCFSCMPNRAKFLRRVWLGNVGGQEVSSAMTPELLVKEGGRLLLTALDVTDVQTLKAKWIVRSWAGDTEDYWFLFNQQTSPKKASCGPIALSNPDWWSHVLGIGGASEVSGLWDGLALPGWKAPQMRLWQVDRWWRQGLWSVLGNEISTTGVEALKNLMQRHVDKARLKRLHTTLCQNCAWHQHTSQAWGISESAGPQLSVSAHDFLEKFAGPMVQNDGRPIHSTAAMEKGGWAVASPPRSLACTVRFSEGIGHCSPTAEENNASTSMQIHPFRFFQHQIRWNVKQWISISQSRGVALTRFVRVECEVRPSKPRRDWRTR